MARTRALQAALQAPAAEAAQQQASRAEVHHHKGQREEAQERKKGEGQEGLELKLASS